MLGVLNLQVAIPMVTAFKETSVSKLGTSDSASGTAHSPLMVTIDLKVGQAKISTSLSMRQMVTMILYGVGQLVEEPTAMMQTVKRLIAVAAAKLARAGKDLHSQAPKLK